MEGLDHKYQKLASEYSKVRSHAAVLKKAVLDEQSKILHYKDTIKEQEQKIRKHGQEMESLIFRNEQLTKRISVLQQELQITNHGKKGKSKNLDPSVQTNLCIIDEELQKKIMENAQLASSMADKEIEINNYKETISWLEDKMTNLQIQCSESISNYKEQIEKLKSEAKVNINNIHVDNHNKQDVCNACKNKNDFNWQHEADRWKAEYELLKNKPETNDQVVDYYESKLRDLLNSNQICEAETKSLWADNNALQSRLEQTLLEKNALESILEKSSEELHTTSENYKSQLDAMTEHLASQNEKITKQCDEIEYLKHKLSLKK